jgi:hypothetical protein
VSLQVGRRHHRASIVFVAGDRAHPQDPQVKDRRPLPDDAVARPTQEPIRALAAETLNASLAGHDPTSAARRAKRRVVKALPSSAVRRRRPDDANRT